MQICKDMQSAKTHLGYNEKPEDWNSAYLNTMTYKRTSNIPAGQQFSYRCCYSIVKVTSKVSSGMGLLSPVSILF